MGTNYYVQNNFLAAVLKGVKMEKASLSTVRGVISAYNQGIITNMERDNNVLTALSRDRASALEEVSYLFTLPYIEYVPRTTEERKLPKDQRPPRVVERESTFFRKVLVETLDLWPSNDDDVGWSKTFTIGYVTETPEQKATNTLMFRRHIAYVRSVVAEWRKMKGY
jgi:hypothetical protein